MSARRKGAALALDLGTKKTGVATSDALRIALEAQPAYRGDERGLLAHVQRLTLDRDLEVIVLGLPLNMDGSESPRSAAVRSFAERLARCFPQASIAFQDERLSTKAAEELGRELGYHGAELRERRDSLSALVILRDWIAAGEPRSA